MLRMPFYLTRSQLSVKRPPASSAKCTCRKTISVFRDILELLLSLLFALIVRRGWSRRIWVCDGVDGAN